MDYDEIRKTIENITKENYGDFIKAVVSFEKGIDDKKVLDKIYDEYMKNDNFKLLNDNFDNLINEFKENGKTVTLTVAECSEFHNMGEFHENITNVAEAISKFKEISNDHIYGLPAIGIRITDLDNTEDYVEMDVLIGDRIDLDILGYVPDIAGNPQAQQMIATLIHDMPETRIEGEIPESIQRKIDKIEQKTKLCAEDVKCEKKKFSADEFLHGVKSRSDNIHSISKDSEIEI